MNKFFCMIIALLLAGSINSYASGPIPYTGDALDKLGKQMKRQPYKVIVGQQPDDYVKGVLSYFRKTYSSVGYDFDKSVVKLAGEIGTDKYSENVITTTIQKACFMVWGVIESNKLNPQKYFDKSTASAFKSIHAYENKIAAQEKAKEEQNQQKAENDSKNQLLSNFTGKYSSENRSIVLMIDKAGNSYNINAFANNNNMLSNKRFGLKYVDAKRKFSDDGIEDPWSSELAHYEGVIDNGGCKIKLMYGKTNVEDQFDYITMEPQQGCQKLSGIAGKYEKR